MVLGLYNHYQGWTECVVIDYIYTADLKYMCVILLLSVTFLLSGMMITYTHTCILLRVRQNARCVPNLPGNLSMSRATRTERVYMLLNTRACKTVLILLLRFSICWTPYTMCLLTFVITRTSQLLLHIWNLGHVVWLH